MLVRTLVCHLVVPGSNLAKVTICLYFYWNFENVLFLILGPSIVPYDCPTWKLHRTGFGMFGIKKLARLERWYMWAVLSNIKMKIRTQIFLNFPNQPILGSTRSFITYFTFNCYYACKIYERQYLIIVQFCHWSHINKGVD